MARIEHELLDQEGRHAQQGMLDHIAAQLIAGVVAEAGQRYVRLVLTPLRRQAGALCRLFDPGLELQ